MASHQDGVPRELVEELQAVVRASTRDGALHPEDALPEDWSRQVLFPAFATNTYEDANPAWATLRVTPSFLQELRRLYGVVTANGLSEVRVPPGSPDEWDIDPTTSLIVEELVVGRHGVNFIACPDGQDVNIETLVITVPTFFDRVLSASPDAVTVLGRSKEEGQDLMDSWQEACFEPA